MVKFLVMILISLCESVKDLYRHISYCWSFRLCQGLLPFMISFMGFFVQCLLMIIGSHVA